MGRHFLGAFGEGIPTAMLEPTINPATIHQINTGNMKLS